MRNAAILFTAFVFGCFAAAAVEAGSCHGTKKATPTVAAPAPVRPVAVEVEQSVLVEPAENGSVRVTESVEVVEAAPGSAAAAPGSAGPGEGMAENRPPKLRTEFRDARKEFHETKKAARYSHRAYRAGRKADAAATEEAAVEAGRDAFKAAK
jgi:hypothetical protein